MRVKIGEPRFTKGDTLRLVPNLTPKNYKNWSEAGLIDIRISGKFRLLSALGVIKLAAINEAVLFGMRSSTAAGKLADRIAPRAIELWDKLPDGYANSEREAITLVSDRERPIFHATFEVDYFIIDMAARLHARIAEQVAAAASKRKAAKKGQRKSP